MSAEQATNNQIMNVLNRIENKLVVHDQRFDEIERNHFDLIDFLKEHMVVKEELRSELGKLNHNLRDYIDRKIYDLRGDLVQIGVLKRV